MNAKSATERSVAVEALGTGTYRQSFLGSPPISNTYGTTASFATDPPACSEANRGPASITMPTTVVTVAELVARGLPVAVRACAGERVAWLLHRGPRGGLTGPFKDLVAGNQPPLPDPLGLPFRFPAPVTPTARAKLVGQSVVSLWVGLYRPDVTKPGQQDEIEIATRTFRVNLINPIAAPTLGLDRTARSVTLSARLALPRALAGRRARIERRVGSRFLSLATVKVPANGVVARRLILDPARAKAPGGSRARGASVSVSASSRADHRPRSPGRFGP